jgi:uncharacterized protein (TIGR01777 family)
MKSEKIILAGGKGFLGHLLAEWFAKKGWEVIILTRHPGNPELLPLKELYWDARTPGPWKESLEGCRALINLTGRSVSCRYNEKNRHEILDSRVESTRALGEAVAACVNAPRVWLNASTATIYRHSLSQPVDESSTDFTPTPEAKDAFSIQVAQAWERAFQTAPADRTRKVALRMAMVLDIQEGTVFRVLRSLVLCGLGGRMGRGKQYVSWIHGLDFCRAIDWILEHDEFSGPINVSAPNPVSNNNLMATIRRVCGCRLGLPAARWMLEPGAFFLRTETELILKSRRVVPGRLLASGFEFRFPQVQSALEDLCARLNTNGKP